MGNARPQIPKGIRYYLAHWCLDLRLRVLSTENLSFEKNPRSLVIYLLIRNFALETH